RDLHSFPTRRSSDLRAPALLRGASFRERQSAEPDRRVAGEQHRDHRQVLHRAPRPPRKTRLLSPATAPTRPASAASAAPNPSCWGQYRCPCRDPIPERSVASPRAARGGHGGTKGREAPDVPPIEKTRREPYGAHRRVSSAS